MRFRGLREKLEYDRVRRVLRKMERLWQPDLSTLATQGPR